MDLNSYDHTSHLILTDFTVNEPCISLDDQHDSRNPTKLLVPHGQRSHGNDSTDHLFKPSEFKRTYHVETKTGKKGLLGLSPTGKIE